MSSRMTARRACDALRMAMAHQNYPEHVIVHTDRVSQYCSVEYRAGLKRHSLTGSMNARAVVMIMPARKAFFTH